MGRIAEFKLDYDDRRDLAVKRKKEKIAMYVALLDAWTGNGSWDITYIKGVRKRLREAQAQLRSLKP